MAVVAIWFIWTVYTVMGAIALIPSNALKVTMGPVLMWSFCALYVLGGLVSLIAPDAVREAGRTFLGRPSARIAGLGYMIIGAALFRVAGTTSLPLLAQVIGVGAFVKGGVQLLLPMVAITVIEWWRDLPALWFRLAAAGAFILAGLFAYAASPQAKLPDSAESPALESATTPTENPEALPAVLPPDTPPAPAETAVPAPAQ